MQRESQKIDFQDTLSILLWGCLLIMIVGALGAIAHQIEAITFRYPLDYGEAPLVNQAVQLNAGYPIYRYGLDQAPYTITNYPPIFVLFMAIFEIIFGPGFWYGRLISSLSAVGSATILTLITYARSRKISTALIPGLLFLNLPYVVGWSALARIDHLALFFALLGLYFLFTEKENARMISPSLIGGSLCLILAIFTRQSYALAAPLAGFLLLIQRHWKKALLLAVIVGGLSLLIFLGLNMATRGGFYFHIVTSNINPFEFERMIDNFRNFFQLAPGIFILATIGLALSIRRVDGWPMMVGFLVGGVLSAVTIGKIGSNVNYFLELAGALCLSIGFGLMMLVREPDHGYQRILAVLFVVVLSWQTVLLIRFVQQDTRLTLMERQQSIDELKVMEDLVRQHNDRPVLADEYMGMILLGGQSLYLQPFEVTQFINAGLFNQNILIGQIQDGYFPLILIQEGSWWSYVAQERWTPELLEAIRSNYRLYAQLEHTNVYQSRHLHSREMPGSCPQGVWDLPTSANLGFQHQVGLLKFFNAGVEGSVPVRAIADGRVYRPNEFPEGSLVVVYNDPSNQGGQVIMLYENMRSFRGDETFILEEFPTGSAGVFVQKDQLLGYQGMWSGKPGQQGWLHAGIGVAPYDQANLTNYEHLRSNLLNPEGYFGIKIAAETDNLQPIICLP